MQCDMLATNLWQLLDVSSTSYKIMGHWQCALVIKSHGHFWFQIVSQALFCTCTYQYLEFWGKLFLALLYTSNMMCSVHCMMILHIESLRNGWYLVKICMHHCCVYIKGNTVPIDVNSFVPSYKHIGQSLTMSTNIYIRGNISRTQFNLYYSSWTMIWQ